MKLPTLLVCCLAFTSALYGQVDTDFWFVAPYTSDNNQNYDKPVYFRISAIDLSSTVTISQPANPSFNPITVTVPAQSTVSVDVTPYFQYVENAPPDQVLNYGFHIVATTEVNIYYELASTYCNCNPELFVLKGKNALGTRFYTPFQNLWPNRNTYVPTPYSAIDIVATQDNTTVTINPSRDIVGHVAGTPFNITLNRGQTYSATATSQLASQHPAGSYVTSNKPIAITLKDDLIHAPFGTCGDLVGDQTIPIDYIGTEYIVIRGGISGNEPVYIVGTQNNTDIFINGSTTPVSTINTGDTYVINDLVVPATYIETSAPAYVLHVTGFNCELGEAVMPTITCTGSPSVSVVRTTSSSFALNILAPSGIENAFTLNGSSSMIPASAFSYVPGTNNNWVWAQIYYSTLQIPQGDVARVSNSMGNFHLGMINGNGNQGARYGYFSNYSEPHALNNDTTMFCFGDTLSIDIGSYWDTIFWVDPTTMDTFSSAPVISIDSTKQLLIHTLLGGCEYLDSTFALENEQIVTTVTPTDIACNGSPTGSLDITVTGGSGNFTYEVNGNPASSQVNFLPAGTYNIQVEDDQSCTDTTSAVINISGNPLTVSAFSSNGSCSNAAYAWANISGGYPPYAIFWSAGNPTPSGDTITNLSPGTYYVTVADDQGCAVADSTTIVTANVQVTYVTGNETCPGYNNGYIALSPTGGTQPYSFTWSAGNSNSTGDSLTGLTAGLYLVTVIDAGGCSITDSISITGSQFFAEIDSFYNVSCNGGSNGWASAVASGGVTPYSYNWSGGIPTGLADDTITGLTAGVYTITVTDSVGCFTIDTFTVTEPGQLLLSIDSLRQAGCASDSSSGSISYSIQGGTTPYSVILNGTPILNTGVADNLVAGSYFIIVADDQGCAVADSASIDTTNVHVSYVIGNETCPGYNNGYIALSPSGGTQPYSFTWSAGSNATGDSATGLSPGTYLVTVSGALSCSDTASIQINASQFFATIDSIAPVNCNGGADGGAWATASGGISPYTYTWSSGTPSATGEQVTGLSAGTYSVSITDQSGCQVIDNVIIDEPALPLIASIGHTDLICYGDNNGQAWVSASGGTGSYTYSWAGGNASGATSDSLTGLIPASYQVVVTDSLGCSVTNAFVLTEPDQLLLSIDSVVQTGCSPVDPTGSISYTLQGGTLPYAMSLNGASITNTGVIDHLPSGNYVINVIDSLGCIISDSTIILSDSIALTNFEVIDETCFGDADGSFMMNIVDGTEPINIYLLPDTTNPVTLPANNLAAGTYTAWVIDAQNCEAQYSFEVMAATQLVTNIEDSVEIFEGQEIELDPTFNFTPTEINWGPSVNISCSNCSNPIVNPDSSITYTYIAYDENGCPVNSAIEVTVINDYGIYIPNAFSPNGDQRNDVYYMYGKGIKKIEIIIFDRWGEIVFRTNDINTGWDGTFKGQPLPPDVFVYTAKVTFYNGRSQFKKGSLLLYK